MRVLLILLVLASCGIKGDPLPVEDTDEQQRVSL